MDITPQYAKYLRTSELHFRANTPLFTNTDSSSVCSADHKPCVEKKHLICFFIYIHSNLFSFQIQIGNKETNIKDSCLFFALGMHFSNLLPLCSSNKHQVFYSFDKAGKNLDANIAKLSSSCNSSALLNLLSMYRQHTYMKNMWKLFQKMSTWRQCLKHEKLQLAHHTNHSCTFTEEDSNLWRNADLFIHTWYFSKYPVTSEVRESFHAICH